MVIRATFVALLCMLVSLLASCSVDRRGNETRAQTGIEKPGCTESASISTPNGHLSNNVWNKRAAGSFRWSQCLEQRMVGNKLQYGWSWEWPPRGLSVLAYPEVIVGAKPWEAGPGNDRRFPRRISDTKKLVISYDVETEASGTYNLATSIWLINASKVANPPDVSSITTEIMVWTEYTPESFTPAGSRRGEVSVDGIDWDVWVASSWGDSSGGNTNRWTYIAYRSKSPMRSIRYDARKFINDAINRGFVTPGLYIADVELGNEIMSGSGRTWLRSFSVDIK